MRELRLTSDQLCRIINTYEKIGKGCYGIIFKITENCLLKFDYNGLSSFCPNITQKESINIADIKNYITLSKKTPSTKAINQNEKIKYLIEKQKKVNLTKLPIGFVYVDGICVGWILKYHKDMISLKNYLKEKEYINKTNLVKIISNIQASMHELIKNHIYQFDIQCGNIMINTKTNKVQLIDFEDTCTEFCNYKNLTSETEVKKKLKDFLIDLRQKSQERIKE